MGCGLSLYWWFPLPPPHLCLFSFSFLPFLFWETSDKALQAKVGFFILLSVTLSYLLSVVFLTSFQTITCVSFSPVSLHELCFSNLPHHSSPILFNPCPPLTPRELPCPLQDFRFLFWFPCSFWALRAGTGETCLSLTENLCPFLLQRAYIAPQQRHSGKAIFVCVVFHTSFSFLLTLKTKTKQTRPPNNQTLTSF